VPKPIETKRRGWKLCRAAKRKRGGTSLGRSRTDGTQGPGKKKRGVRNSRNPGKEPPKVLQSGKDGQRLEPKEGFCGESKINGRREVFRPAEKVPKKKRDLSPTELKNLKG